MKKILFAITIVMTMVVSTNAQRNDSFFSNWDNDIYSTRESDPMKPLVPGVNYNNENDVNAPLGSGLLVLTALGAGYAVARKRSKK